MTNDGDFISQGFDLDAAAAVSDGDDVVFEIGGGATIIPSQTEEKSSLSGAGESSTSDKQKDEESNLKNEDEKEANKNKTKEQTLLEKAEDWKQEGNVQFKAGNYLEAIDLYTEAIEACPCPVKGKAILELQKQHDKAEHEARLRKFRQAEIDRENERKEKFEKEKQKKKEGESTEKTTTEKKESEQPKKQPTTNDDDKPKPFVLPPQLNGDKLAIFYNNRAAAYYQVKNYQNSVEDCNVAILLNPKYTKAYVRRSMAYEKLPTSSTSSSSSEESTTNESTFGQSATHTEQALNDMKVAQMLEPKNPTINKNVKRLQKLEDERLEKLKAETMDKLKDLGNSILGNFGLSLDNFKTVQDPKTGSYNIQFEQNSSK